SDIGSSGSTAGIGSPGISGHRPSGVGSSGSTAGIGSPGMTAGTGSSGIGLLDSRHRVTRHDIWHQALDRLARQRASGHQA
ncbi:unnamed protein product, partial [Staurois parvus]